MGTSISPPNIVIDGLILYLDAANHRSYPRTGTLWRDLSRNKHVATLYNGVSYSKENAGCMVFDGVNDYAQITLSSVLTVNTLSYNMWFNKDPGTQIMTIFDQDNDNWFLGISNNQLISQDPNYNIGQTITPGRWYNITMTHTLGGPVYFYMNGSLVYTSGNDTTSQLTTSFNIGAGVSLGVPNDFFDGKISVVQMYNRELSAVEVGRNYLALRGRYGV